MRTLATHGDGVPCGLPSNGSRLQSVQAGLHPADPDRALTTTDPAAVTCKRCRRIQSKDRIALLRSLRASLNAAGSR